MAICPAMFFITSTVTDPTVSMHHRFRFGPHRLVADGIEAVMAVPREPLATGLSHVAPIPLHQKRPDGTRLLHEFHVASDCL